MNRFKQIIENGYQGFNTQDARAIIRDSAEVSRYIEEKRKHLSYVQQLMNDKIIDEAMGRLKSNGEFEYNGDGGFEYRPNSLKRRNVILEQYPLQTVNNNVMSRLDAMEREMEALRAENRELKTRYGMLK